MSQHPAGQAAPPMDKDRKMKIMDKLIKTSQQHIELLKQTVSQLKKQLNHETLRNQDLEKEIASLKQQVKLLSQKPQQIHQGTQTDLRKEVRQSSIKSAKQSLQDGALFVEPVPFEQITTTPMRSDTNQKHKQSLKLDVTSALKRQPTMGPLTSVKKSTTYLSSIHDEKLIGALKERIPVLAEKSARHSFNHSQCINRPKSLLFNFSQSQIFPSSSTQEISEFNQDKKQQGFATIQEESANPLPQDSSALKQDKLKLFSKFFILGCKKSEFLEFDQDQTVKEGILPASVLFRSDEGAQDEEFESTIRGFVYPFGNQVEKIKVNDSFRKLKEIMYSGNKYDLLDKFHIFTIKSQEFESDQKEYSNIALLEACNPQKLMYGICLSVYDYIETTPDDVKLTFANRKKRTFWRYKKAYCFLTYFPFIELFQDLLIAIINLIKISRTSRFVQKNTEEYEALKEMDGQQIIVEFEGQLRGFLNSVSQVYAEQGHQQLQIDTDAGILKYKIPNQMIIHTELRLWSANIALQLINNRDLVTVFMAMLQEIPLVFISERLNLLTATIHFFHNLIYPFQWTSPIIYNVPEYLLTMLESPVPIITGLNLSEQDLTDFQIKDKVDSAIFIFLDREQKVEAKPFALLNQIKVPQFGGMVAQIEHQTRQQSMIRNPSPGMRPNSRDDKKGIKFAFDEQDLQKSRSVLDLFQKMLTVNIIQNLPKKEFQGLVHHSGSLNIALIEQYLLKMLESKDREVIKELMKTQLFQYFLQEHYLLN